MIKTTFVCLAAILLALWMDMTQSASSQFSPPPTPTNEPIVIPAPARPEPPVQKHKDKHSSKEVTIQMAEVTVDVNWQSLGFITEP